MLNRFSDLPTTSIFSKRLLCRSAFMAALIALIYVLQFMADRRLVEETTDGPEPPESKAEMPFGLPALGEQPNN